MDFLDPGASEVRSNINQQPSDDDKNERAEVRMML
uniref:Uncharacterized protein n=1 Tax=Acrobeloides nanus TaxID=290746 RepID=A0A914E3Q7_9BILA